MLISSGPFFELKSSSCQHICVGPQNCETGFPLLASLFVVSSRFDSSAGRHFHRTVITTCHAHGPRPRESVAVSQQHDKVCTHPVSHARVAVGFAPVSLVYTVHRSHTFPSLCFAPKPSSASGRNSTNARKNVEPYRVHGTGFDRALNGEVKEFQMYFVVHPCISLVPCSFAPTVHAVTANQEQLSVAEIPMSALEHASMMATCAHGSY